MRKYCQSSAGRIEILVNNLGIFEPRPFEEIPDADWLRFFEVNVLSGARLARLVLPAMRRANWGRILFISSESGVHIPAAIDTRAIRKTLKLTQQQFATRYQIPVATLRDWEQGRRMPDAPARALIAAIREEPEVIRRALKRAAA